MKKIIENVRKIYKPILLISVAFLLLISVFAITSKDKFFWTGRITERNLVPGENYFSKDNMIINFGGYQTNLRGLYIGIYALPHGAGEDAEGIQIYVYINDPPYEPLPGEEPEYIIINDRNLEELQLVTTRYADSVVNYLPDNSRITRFICKLNNGNDRYVSHGAEFTEICYGGQGADYIEADGSGETYVAGGEVYQGDVLRGGDGDDWIIAKGAGYKMIYGDDGNDNITCQDLSQNNVFGGNDTDFIIGGPGPDNLQGGSGYDNIRGGGDVDMIQGNMGSDTLYGEDGNDYLYGNEQNDTLYGGEGNDELHGGAGTDQLYGEAGEDDLWGGAGADYFWGGPGSDIFHGTSPLYSDTDAFFGIDIVYDFHRYRDELDEWENEDE